VSLRASLGQPRSVRAARRGAPEPRPRAPRRPARAWQTRRGGRAA
jgi:hypothetical protein